MRKFLYLALFVVSILPAYAFATHIDLNKNWTVQVGCTMLRANLPATAMGILFQNGIVHEKILSGLNYKKVDKSIFDHPWLFRKYFKLPVLRAGQHAFLNIEGINYSANVLINEKLIASGDSIVGPYRQHMLDITKWVSVDNTLTIQVKKAAPGDLNIGFADWNPSPADGSMGIFRSIGLDIVNDVLMRNVNVQSKVNTKTLEEAWLTVGVELQNLTDHTVKGTLVGKIEKEGYIYMPVTLDAGEHRIVKITPAAVPALDIKRPRLWWCNNMGTPNMYNLSLEYNIENKICDKSNITFGIREIKDYLTPEGYRGLMLNGRKVLIRGAGWSDDIFLRNTPKSYENQIRLVKDMNLNAIRLENFWGTSQALFDYCDKYGIMVLDGISCYWEGKDCIGGDFEDDYGCIHTPEQEKLVCNSLHDQVMWLCNHPCVVGWFIGSDKSPRPEFEKVYRNMLATIDNRPIFISAQQLVSPVSGKSGVKMEGPYEYVGPKYWFGDLLGGAYGFNTETSIGAQLPVKESIARMIPASKMWPVNNDYYNYHCSASKSGMNNLNVLTDVINHAFGGVTNLDDYLHKADLLNYNSTRSMFEAFRVNIPHTTGIIQWMLNAAWPKLYWQLYDYYGVPTAAYFSVKQANEPQQLIYDYKDHAVYAVNESLRSIKATASLKLFNLRSKLVQEVSDTITVEPYTVKKVFDVDMKDVKDNAFLFLELKEGTAKISNNEYCLSKSEDVYDYKKSNWFVTPMSEVASYRALSTLPSVKLEIKTRLWGGSVTVALKNTSDKISFFNRLTLLDSKGAAIGYVRWNDNYVTLQPGETRGLCCEFTGDTHGVSLLVNSWNGPCQTIKL